MTTYLTYHNFNFKKCKNRSVISSRKLLFKNGTGHEYIFSFFLILTINLVLIAQQYTCIGINFLHWQAIKWKKMKMSYTYT